MSKPTVFLSLILCGLIILFSQSQASAAGKDLPPLVLEDLLKEVHQNAEVLVARKKWEASREKAAQASALEDPMLGLGIVNLPTNMNFRSEDMTMKEFSISQKVPFPGKRTLMGRMAEDEADSVQTGIQDRINRLIKEIKSAFFDLSFAYQAAEVTQRNKEVLQSYIKVAESRYALGQGQKPDLVKTHLKVTKMVDDLLMLDSRKKALAAKINALLNRPGSYALGRPQDKPARPLPLSLDQLQCLALEANPSLAGMKKMIQAKEKAQALAQKEYFPDFNFRVAYGQRDRTIDGNYRRDVVSGMVEVNVPIFTHQKQDRKVAETAADVGQATAQYEAMKQDIFYMISEALAMTNRWWKQMELYRTGTIPQINLQIKTAMNAYSANKAEFMDVLDYQMTLYQAELEYQNAVAEYQKGLAVLEFAVGKPLF